MIIMINAAVSEIECHDMWDQKLGPAVCIMPV